MKRFAYLVFVLAACSFTFGQAQYKVLYNFGANGPSDGSQPKGRLLSDEQGNLYGTTFFGGNIETNGCNPSGCGTVFELTPNSDGTWSETTIYVFCQQSNCADGAGPEAGLVADAAGNLYGTTVAGGGIVGTVFELSPPSIPSAAWTERVLWSFGSLSVNDGINPFDKLIFDSVGNLYGTTRAGGVGQHASGTVFKLSPLGDGTWNESLLYTFNGSGRINPYGSFPYAALTMDNQGNLYGTASYGGKNLGGVVFQLTPGSGTWTQSLLHLFSKTLSTNTPVSSLSLDASGNLYGTTSAGGTSASGCKSGCGGVFELLKKNGNWQTIVLPFNGTNGGNPAAGVYLDGAGRTAYGTTQYGGANGQGVVFAAKTSGISAIYSFCSQANCADGSQPVAALTPDGKGNYYGMTTLGGTYNQGVVFEITP